MRQLSRFLQGSAGFYEVLGSATFYRVLRGSGIMHYNFARREAIPTIQPKAVKITLAVVVALLIGVLMVAGLTITASGQTEKPDFSGRWVMVTPAEGAGLEQVVKQDATTLTIGPTPEGQLVVYKLDGTENRIVMTSGVVMTSKASWTGNQLTITSTTPSGLDQKQVWSIDGDGKLVIDVQNTLPTQAPIKMTMTYKKQ
jgi:hypothetical protein